MADEKDSKRNAIDRAFADLADEFSENAQGAGASLGRSAKFLASTVEVVVTSPLLIPKGYKKLVEKMKPLIDNEVRKIPEDKIVEPDLSIAGPALEAMRFAVDDAEIAEMFAKLLAGSMHADRKARTHHSFVEVIKQLSPAEARLIRFLGEKSSWAVAHLKSVNSKGVDYKYRVQNATDLGDRCGVPERALVQIYIDNLCRLGLCKLPWDTHLADEDAYKRIELDEAMQKHVRAIEESGEKPEFDRGVIELTEYGTAFFRICVQKT